MVEKIVKDLKTSMDQSIESLRRELAKRRTGRANIAMLDGVRVDYYGTKSPLNQVGSVQVPDPRMITIKPWDKSVLHAIEKAIQQSSLGLNPTSDGELVRIPIPPLTGERRKELVKDIKKTGEEAKVVLRNQRRDANEGLKGLEKEKKISEDDLRRGMEQVQKSTDEFIAVVDKLISTKETEILED
jgi:ribosome recycling factor